MGRISTWETGRNGKASALKAAAVGVVPTWGFKSSVFRHGERPAGRGARLESVCGVTAVRGSSPWLSAKVSVVQLVGRPVATREVAGSIPARDSLRGARMASGGAAIPEPSTRACRFESCPLSCGDCGVAVARRAVAPEVLVQPQSIAPRESSSNWTEQRSPNPPVAGSSPASPAHDGVAQLAGRLAVNEEDAGSNPATVAMCPCPNWQRSPAQNGEDPGSTPGGHTRASTPTGRGVRLRACSARVRIPPRPHGAVTQLVECRTENPDAAVRSRPVPPHARVAQLGRRARLRSVSLVVRIHSRAPLGRHHKAGRACDGP